MLSSFTIENFKNYSEYLNIRADLILEEFYTDANWETVKIAYMDTRLQEYRYKHQSITGAKPVNPEVYKHQSITGAKPVNPEVTDWWITVDENALPNIPGVIYVQKTESRANIWYTSSKTESENGEILSVEGSELSEKQKLDLLNTGTVPKGWEVVYVDEDGNPIR